MTDPQRMVRCMQGLTADAATLKSLAGVPASGRNLSRPYEHVVLSWPKGTKPPSRAHALDTVQGALDALGLDDRHRASWSPADVGRSLRACDKDEIVQGLDEAGVSNPVVILDEIDKVGRRTSNVGNPAAALLEVLDPAQNTAFVERYVGLPVDLSEVLWIGTANNLEAMPAPLRDRMDVIEVPGYTDEEKIAIVKRHLERIVEGSGLAVERLWTDGPGLTPRRPTDAGPAGAGRVLTFAVKRFRHAGKPTA